eukprot:TRINITY_DN1534_c0_g2_i1.p1 TRINITY_DN1534_c0_g2~~TRINITY_DN1534_c0_g2_i1.p1  ORF type:complete len:553 (-),score=127.37 TRINITY_DN1534_c0_g2_i1:234-1892(-)
MWHQSYRQSMDVMASPSIPNFVSPLSHRLGSSFMSPYPSYQQPTPIMSMTADGREWTRPPRPTAARPPPAIDHQHQQQYQHHHHHHHHHHAQHAPPHEHKVVDESKQPLIPHKGSDLCIVDEEVQGRGDVHGESLPPGSSFMQALFNGCNILAGVGVLSMPYAVMNGGWLSLGLLFSLAVACWYTGYLLRVCLQSEPGLETYPDIGEAAFGPTGRLIISIVLYVELYACCVEFLILEGDNLSAQFPGASLQLGSVFLSSQHLFIIVAAICILPTMYLRDLSILSYISAGGMFATLLVCAMVMLVGVQSVGFEREADGQLLNLWGMPMAIGLYGFCYSGHAVFPNIYMSMRNKKEYDTVLLWSFVLCTIIYTSMAIGGYLMFGDSSSSQITLNLPENLLASRIAVWTTVVNPYTKFALSMLPVARCLEELLPMPVSSKQYKRASTSIRTILVASTVVVALLIPFFGYVMSFIGSFLSMAVSVILPCACYIRIQGKRATLGQKIVCSILILLGLFCAAAGTYSSVSKIVNSLSGNEPDNLTSALASAPPLLRPS